MSTSWVLMRLWSVVAVLFCIQKTEGICKNAIFVQELPRFLDLNDVRIQTIIMMATPNKMPKLSEEPASSSVSDKEEVEFVDEPSTGDVADGESNNLLHVDDSLSRAMDGCSMPDLDKSLGTSNSNSSSSQEVAAGGAGVRMEVWCEARGMKPPSPIGSQESPEAPQEKAPASAEFEPAEEGGDEVVDAGIDGGMAMPASGLEREMKDFRPHQENDDALRFLARVIAEDNLAWVSSNDDGPSWDNFADWAEINGLPRPPCLFPQYEYDFLNELYLLDGN